MADETIIAGDAPVEFWFLTDFHLGEGSDSLEQFEQIADRLAASRPQPAAILLGGDICLHHEGAADAYERFCQRLHVPVFHAVGNHDVFVDRPDPAGEFARRFGAPNRAVDVRGVRLILLNACEPHPELTGWQNVQGFVDEATLAWLDEVLADTPLNVPVVLVSHIPLRTTFMQRRSGSRLDRLAWHVRNAPAVLERLRRFQRVVVLQGHLHENERLRDGAIELLSTGAVCGAWWNRKGHPYNVDGSPKGYRRILVPRDGPIRSEYVSLDPCCMRPGHATAQAAEAGLDVFVNLYDAPSSALVEVRLHENEPWQAGQSWTDLNPASPQRAAHVWRHRLCGHGRKTLPETCQVRLQDASGSARILELPLHRAAHRPEAAR